MYKNHIEMMVCIDGKPVREYRHNGLVFVEARKGSTYSIKLKNNFNRRAMAILSVDGIEVLKGKKAELAEGGYVLDPYSSIEIRGYRISDTEVATFVFGSGYNSYSTYVGQTAGELAPGESSKNNGVIGVRVVLEKYQEPNWEVQKAVTYNYDWQSSLGSNTIGSSYGSNIAISGYCGSNVTGCFHAGDSVLRGSSPRARILYNNDYPNAVQGQDSSDMGAKGFSITRADINNFGSLSAINRSDYPVACAAYSSTPVAPSFDVGTEWGEKKEDKIKRVAFEISEEAFEMSLYYASREALEKVGIDFTSSKPIASGMPQAFGNKYCTPPKGYKV